MTFALIYWILMLLWLVFGVWGWYNPDPRFWFGHGLFFFALFLLLGWAVFGAPVR